MEQSQQFKVQQMVSLSDVENFIKQLEALRGNMPSFDRRKHDDLVEEVAELVNYAKLASDWFKNFSEFVICIGPNVKKSDEKYMPRNSSLENLIARATT